MEKNREWRFPTLEMGLETDKNIHEGADRKMKEKKYKTYPELSTSAQLKGSLTSLQTYNTKNVRKNVLVFFFKAQTVLYFP